MSSRNYWLDLFTWATWQEFLNQRDEPKVSGFREGRWNTVQQMKPGDYLLCYLTGISRWIGLLEVVSEPFMDNTRIWEEDAFPSRVRVKPLVELTPETAVPIFELRDRPSIFENLGNPNAWTGYRRGSPSKWKASDGEVVVKAVQEAKRNPISRPVDRIKLRRKPPVIQTKIGSVTNPGIDKPAAKEDTSQEEALEIATEPRLHAEIQWLLLKLGNAMGLDVWVATNDRGQAVNGHKFTDLPRL